MSSVEIRRSDNPVFKHLKKLAKSRSYRHEHQECLVFGEKAIQEALASKLHVKDLWVTTKNRGLLQEQCPKVLVANLFNELSDSPQIRVIGQFHLPKFEKEVQSQWEKIFFLADLQDPNNVGAIIRSARAFGIDAVCVSKKCVDIFHPRVWRSSLGALAHVSILVETDDLWVQLKSHGFHVIALDASAEHPLNQMKASKVMALFGQEGQGIAAEYLARCDQTLSIPIQAEADSVNVAAAAAIVAYQLQS